jgi:hypothetical protein
MDAMYCQSCQTKLSPRDQNCPTCGRRSTSARDLGSSSASGDSGSSAFPLPPAEKFEEEEKKGRRPRKSAGSRKSAKPAASERRKSADRRRPSAAPAPKRDSSSASASLRPEDVRRMLVQQPDLIEPGLEIYSEDGEMVGVGYSTAVGEIDLLARDDSGCWVVIAVAEPDEGKELVGDLLQRMGWVRRHLGKSGQEVRGMVLLDALPDDLGYAAAAVADTVEFKMYQLALTLEAVIV